MGHLAGFIEKCSGGGWAGGGGGAACALAWELFLSRVWSGRETAARAHVFLVTVAAMSSAWMYGVAALTLLALLTLTDGTAERWLVYAAGEDPPAHSESPARRPWRKRVHQDHEPEGGGPRSRRGNHPYDMHQMGTSASHYPYLNNPLIRRYH